MFNSSNKALDLRDSYKGPGLKIFVRDVRDKQGRKRALTVRSWSTVKDVKDVLRTILNVPSSALRLYYGPLMTSGGELPNHRTLHDAGIYRGNETLLLEIKGAAYAGISSNVPGISSLRPSAVNDVCVSSSMVDSTPKPLKGLVQQARRGFNMGLKPELVLDGSGGSYFLHDARKVKVAVFKPARKVKVAVFKPADEEPFAENNPRGYVKQGDSCGGLRAGVRPGELCLREVAAFRLDHGGFSGVPMTTLAEARHPAFNTNGAMMKVSQGGASIGSHSLGGTGRVTDEKLKKVGSFQEFVRTECTMDDMSPSMISVDEVHKIAILDIRLMNADRNTANLLCRRRRDNSLELVPIDHGYCLRSVCDVSWMDWCWLEWPHLKEPLSERSKNYITRLDIEKDAAFLKEHLNISTAALDYFRASSKLLQAGVKAGLSLYDIAIMCCRNDDAGEIPSKLEKLSSMASELALSVVENGRWHHTTASKALAEQLSPNGASLIGCEKDVGSPRIAKSASSANFSSFLAEPIVELISEEVARGDAPAMTQSSVSDSSSDVGDAAMEQEEWAASIIADVSMSGLDFVLDAGSTSKELAAIRDDCSEDSSTSDSNNRSQFWVRRPGSDHDDDSDDDTTSWSPHMSPRNTVSLSSRLISSESMGDEDFTSPTARFVDALPVALLPPPATVSVTCFKSSGVSCKENDDQTSGSTAFSMLRNSSRMKRSQSYSAISGMRTSGIDVESDRCVGVYAANDEHFRDYVAKFVDLVIDREMTVASTQKQVRTE